MESDQHPPTSSGAPRQLPIDILHIIFNLTDIDVLEGIAYNSGILAGSLFNNDFVKKFKLEYDGCLIVQDGDSDEEDKASEVDSDDSDDSDWGWDDWPGWDNSDDDGLDFSDDDDDGVETNGIIKWYKISKLDLNKEVRPLVRLNSMTFWNKRLLTPLSCVKGLVLLIDKSDQLWIYNPLTKEALCVPAAKCLPLSSRGRFNCFGTYSFGFIGEQLKIVRFMHSVAQVYVVGTRHWRIVGPISPDHEPAEPHALSLDGNIFYLTFNASDYELSVFDLTTETFSSIHFAGLGIDEEGYHLVPTLSLVSGKVCASYASQTHLSLWVLSFESQPTWTRIFNIPINTPQGTFPDKYNVLMSLTQDDTPETLYMVINDNQLAEYSTSTNVITLIGSKSRFLAALHYVPSFFGLRTHYPAEVDRIRVLPLTDYLPAHQTAVHSEDPCLAVIPCMGLSEAHSNKIDFIGEDTNVKADCKVTYDSEDGILKEFLIPDYVFIRDAEVQKHSHVPVCPVIVFVNVESGGQLGRELLDSYQTLLNENQVIDLSRDAPDEVLRHLCSNLEKLTLAGDLLAPEIERNLKIIVAGGDGTAGWILGIISDLNLARPPPVAIVPLGTRNNAPAAFGWGKKNPGTDHDTVKMFLEKVKDAKEINLASWQVLMMKVPGESTAFDPVAPLELPHSLHPAHCVSQPEPNALEEVGYHTFRGGFWNYFSIGMDAQVSYGFHTERKLHPEKFNNQSANQIQCHHYTE